MKIPGGWSQTPNEIIAAMPLMNGSEFKCTMVLIRHTYGYHRRQVKLMYEDFRRQTGIKSNETLAAALKAVDSRGFFVRFGGTSKWMIGDWCDLEEGAGTVISDHRVADKRAIKEAKSSIIEQNGSIKSSIIEQNAGSNSSIIEQSGSVKSSIIEQNAGSKSSIIELLPLYKERSPTGKEREGERKGQQPHRKMPIPRTDGQRELAAHPAAGAWLEAGLAWPGWHRMAIIRQRLGEEPQIEALKKARELWLLAGYRPGNSGGILDWYEALCRDGTWRPFGRRTGQSARAPAGGEGAVNPTMAMLQRVKEERMHGG